MSYHTLSHLNPIFDRKLIPVATLNLVPRLLKMLSHLAISYDALSHLVILYPPSLIEN